MCWGWGCTSHLTVKRPAFSASSEGALMGWDRKDEKNQKDGEDGAAPELSGKPPRRAPRWPGLPELPQQASSREPLRANGSSLGSGPSAWQSSVSQPGPLTYPATGGLKPSPRFSLSGIQASPAFADHLEETHLRPHALPLAHPAGPSPEPPGRLGSPFSTGQ